MRRHPLGPSAIALVDGDTGPTLWRVYGPLTALERRGYPCGWDRLRAPGILELASKFEVIILPRLSWGIAHRAEAQSWFRHVKARGHTVVYEVDDDILTTAHTARALSADWTDGKSLEQMTAERYDVIWTLQQADGVTVSTAHLAGVVRQFTDRPVIVVPNAIDAPWFKTAVRASSRHYEGPAGRPTMGPLNPHGVVIGWAGGRRDEADLVPMAEGWRQIAEAHPSVSFVVAGWRSPTLLGAVPSERVTVRPWAPLASYPSVLAGLTIGCAAVEDEPFNANKSPIKCYEYALAGAAVVATPTIYGEVIRHGENGLLAETDDQWTTALDELICRPSWRSLLAGRLAREVERRYSLSANLAAWPAAWAAIAEDARARRGRLVALSTTAT